MKRLFCAFSLFILFSNTLAFAQGDPYFLANPALSPDGQMVVFSFDGDLWKVSSAGESASRITAMPGDEINTRISPDIFVKTTFMARLQGKDPQIERAVAKILKDLKK
ncbi:tricorn protease-like protein [Pedobacter sp. UYP24]